MRNGVALRTPWWVAAISFGILPAGMAATDPWIEDATQAIYGEAIQGAISGAIDYVSLRTAMQLKPGIIQAKLDACGDCSERAALEKELAVANQDKQALASLESVVAQALNMDTWTAWKLGIKVHPDTVTQEPQACIALYDRAIDCAVEHDDRASWRIGGDCYSELHLHDLCAKGVAQPFYEYARYINLKNRGELVSETEDNRFHYYYNVPPGLALPEQPVVIDKEQYLYGVITDSRQPGAVRSLTITAFPWLGPPGLSYANPEDFIQPWSKIVHEDNTEASKSGRLLECVYVMGDPNILRLQVFYFWYGPKPGVADASYLVGRMQNHPLLRVGPSVDSCPTNAEQAAVMNPLVPRDVLKQQYAGLLR